MPESLEHHSDRRRADSHLRVYIDISAILSDGDWERVRSARTDTALLEDPKLLRMIASDFEKTFGPEWWGGGGLYEFAGSRIQWTLHSPTVGDLRENLLFLMSSDRFTGYFFVGARLLIDRLYSGQDCDVYITRDPGHRISEPGTAVLQVGSAGFETWSAVARHLTSLA